MKTVRFVAALCAIMSYNSALAEYTNNILITGYWPPTNEMIRPWNANPVQNPAGWVGGNWEGRGYDIHAYFPEFPGGVDVNPQGNGDFEVDYQDTSNDWWRIVEEIQPVAIITFSRGNPDLSWELESRTRNWANANWVPDYTAPLRPTPELPIFNEPAGTVRNSTLPMDAIEAAVDEAGLGLTAYIDRSNEYGGRFLSNYIGYHGSWYHDLHSSPSDAAWNVAAGHIHVGIGVSTEQGRAATELSLRELIAYVDSQVPEPSTASLLLAGVAFVLRSRRARE